MDDTDEAHPLTATQLCGKLKPYGFSVERKTIYSDIEALQLAGLDIVLSTEYPKGYFVASRQFELAELKLLTDAVQSSRFITQKKSEQLVEKLSCLASSHQAKELSRQIYLADRVKSINEQIYYSIDTLHSAIRDGFMIQFQYREYGIDKELHLKRNGEIYSVSPYMLFWHDSYYYLVAWHDRYDGLSHFRVDKMTNISITFEPVKKTEIDPAAYAKKVFNMFTGENTVVQMEFDNSLISAVIDRFGRDADIRKNDDSTFILTIEVAVSSAFYSYLFKFGSKAKILSPDWVVNGMTKIIEEVKSKYLLLHPVVLYNRIS